MRKNVKKLSVFGATSAVMLLAAPLGGPAFAGPVGLAVSREVALPAPTESVRYDRIYHGRTVYGERHYGWHRGYHRHVLYGGRSAYRRICEHRTAYDEPRYITEGRTAYVAAPVVSTPVIAAYPAYTYGYPYGGGYGDAGFVEAGAGLLGGLFNVDFGGGAWGNSWGGRGPYGWQRGWRRHW